MPDAPEHPVTVGDLRVVLRVDWSGDPFEDRDRPATVADLVSALRAEGVLEREWRCWREDGSYYGPCSEEQIAHWKESTGEGWWHRHFDCGWQWSVMEADALAEAQPLPPAGGVS